MYHFNGDYMGDKEHRERIMRRGGSAVKESTNNVNLDVCQKNCSAEFYGVRWVLNNVLLAKFNNAHK